MNISDRFRVSLSILHLSPKFPFVLFSSLSQHPYSTWGPLSLVGLLAFSVGHDPALQDWVSNGIRSCINSSSIEEILASGVRRARGGQALGRNCAGLQKGRGQLQIWYPWIQRKMKWGENGIHDLLRFSRRLSILFVLFRFQDSGYCCAVAFIRPSCRA